MITERLRRDILCAQLNVWLARDFTHLAPTARLAEIEHRNDVLNDLLDQVPH